MAPLSDFELFLPYAQWKDRDWATSIRAAEGLDRRLLQLQEMAVHALAEVEPSPVTPEKLAWVVLWARCFTLLQSACDLRGAPAVRVTDALHRIAFELWLHVEAIRQPWESLNGAQQQSSISVKVGEERLAATWHEVADRLRAFAAWALTSDLRYHRWRAKDWELQKRYRKTNPNLLPKTPVETAIHSYVLGEIEIVSDAEAAQDRANARAAHEAAAQRLLGWLTDPVFGHWRTDLAPWITGKSKDEFPTFFELVDKRYPSARAVLRQMDAEHLYGVYQRGSMILHGSSILEFVTVGGGTGGVIIPQVLAPEDEGDELCSSLAKACHGAMLGLWGMRDRCLK